MFKAFFGADFRLNCVRLIEAELVVRFPQWRNKEREREGPKEAEDWKSMIFIEFLYEKLTRKAFVGAAPLK